MLSQTFDSKFEDGKVVDPRQTSHQYYYNPRF